MVNPSPYFFLKHSTTGPRVCNSALVQLHWDMFLSPLANKFYFFIRLYEQIVFDVLHRQKKYSNELNEK